MTELPPELYRWLKKAKDVETWRDRRYLRNRIKLHPKILEQASAAGRVGIDSLINRLFNHPYDSFEPRPAIDGVDEQEPFYESDSLVSCAVGGNASGKTFTAAQRVARFLADTPPPKPNTPFWCIANTLDQCCEACWDQKLSQILPKEWIDEDRIDWYKPNKNFPYTVPLKAHENGNSWKLEFKSYEQRMASMSASAIGGAWFTEQFPWEVFLEVLRGCREYGFPGSVTLEFTPVDPAKSIEIEKMYNAWLQRKPAASGWSFFRLNTDEALKAGHVDKTWFDTFFGGVSEEMQATRKAGEFASYEGVIYKTLNPRIHFVDSTDFLIPDGCIHKRAFDWGSSESHPLVCLWGAKDGIGRWIIYDEYWCNDQSIDYDEHCLEIRTRHNWSENDPYKSTSYGDPSRPDMFREFGKRGVHVQPANNAVYDGIETVRQALKVHPIIGEPMLIILADKCPHLVEEIRTYRWKQPNLRGINPQAPKPEPLKFKDDTCDAIRYLCHSDKQSSEKSELTSIEKHRPNRESVKFQR